jgi:polyisoprenoid-binding protein YceI
METSKAFSRVFNGNLLPAAGEYKIDRAHTFVEFATQHIVVGRVLGRFDKVSGNITIADNPLLSKVEFTVETSSISTHHPDRDADLRSPRFFDVEKFPQMMFVSTEIKTEPRGQFVVEGNLTLRGMTHLIPFNVRFNGMVDDPWGNTRAAFEAKNRLNREDFALLADLQRETGGLPVGKDVKIKVAIESLLKK